MSTPFEDKRRTNSMDVRRANIYKRISEVWDQLGGLQMSELPRWVAVFEEEAKKPLAVIGLKRNDIKQAARDYRLMQDLYESVANIRDAALRLLAEAHGQKADSFDPLNLDTLSRCIDHHASELFRLRAKVQQLEALLEKNT